MKLFVLFLSLFAVLHPQQVLDKIVAVVDNEYILQSELDFQVNMVAQQRKISPDNPALREQILNAIIEEKLVYAQANFDSVFVTEEEVSRQIDYQMNVFIQQYGSKEKVEEAYGMPLEKIKRELRDDVRKNLMVQRMREKKFGMVEASQREIEEFFITYKDSLGVIPEKVQISHIYMNPKLSSALKQKFRTKIESILDSIKGGEDFSELAKKYSDDPASAVHGGDLGFVKKGVFYPEFESAAFALKEGEISGIVESPVGFHIIQLLERRGEAIKTRHILVKLKSDDEADLDVIQRLTDVRDSVVRKFNTFSYYAKKYSDDKNTAALGGELGSFYLSQLDKSLLDAVSKMKEGEISYPKRVDYGVDTYGYHVIFLEKRIPQHQPSLEIDFQELKKFADEYKKQNLYQTWIQEIKNKIYWEIKI
ncbi:MAG: parvulin peptidyl-prolyl isomerase [Ignavibacteriales bacterium]|nr:parvulin peptidyl-prolyl isomerase [Ignavibacteriales bacterium]